MTAGSTAATTASVLSVAGTAAQLAGGVVGGIGAINSAEVNANAAKYQAQVAANNQQLATQKVQQTAAAGAANTEQSLLRTREIVGAAEKASQAASGIDVNTGSAVDVRSSSAALGELDALTVRANAARQAYGYETAATSSGAGCVVASGIPAGAKPLSPPLLSSVCWHPARREWPRPQYARDRQRSEEFHR